jgi:hypothetical protein
MPGNLDPRPSFTGDFNRPLSANSAHDRAAGVSALIQPYYALAVPLALGTMRLAIIVNFYPLKVIPLGVNGGERFHKGMDVSGGHD